MALRAQLPGRRRPWLFAEDAEACAVSPFSLSVAEAERQTERAVLLGLLRSGGWRVQKAGAPHRTKRELEEQVVDFRTPAIGLEPLLCFPALVL